eukprot:CAMPEP_0179852944 /NCGR_PEP_ID=MMETSP0982-20121206/9083_1 /TAXON_ID=483367 /ORGANISM="non described non described, Strain CCMP 2436" /LENGTH=63 /DNA_ID=CAMNT_0021738623 /DNA_START=245 /DNA_END=436 /DNA_ORIENTATION=+
MRSDNLQSATPREARHCMCSTRASNSSTAPQLRLAEAGTPPLAVAFVPGRDHAPPLAAANDSG